MKWIVIPWLISLAWFAVFYIALDDAVDALITTSLPILISIKVTAWVIYTYRKWLEDRASAERIAEAMSWNLPDPSVPANQNQRPRSA
jgi:hypothetical protein